MDPRWQHPFTCIVAGPTGCGKTQWVMTFLRHLNEMTCPVPRRIVWSYGEWQPVYQHLPRQVKLVRGWPELSEFGTDPVLLIIDDQMQEADDRLTRLFTKGSHHRNISVVYIVQNLFDKNKEHRTISLNAHYMVLFKNPRDGSQIINLAKQMYPGRVEYLRGSFELATRRPYGYLLVDLKQCTPEGLRLRSRIFPDKVQEVYVHK